LSFDPEKRNYKALNLKMIRKPIRLKKAKRQSAAAFSKLPAPQTGNAELYQTHSSKGVNA
jgi:hypothetical protein